MIDGGSAKVEVNILAVAGAVLGLVASLVPWLEMSMGPDTNPWFLFSYPYISNSYLFYASLGFLLGVLISFITNLGVAPAACGLLVFYLGAPYEWSQFCGPNRECLAVLVYSSIGQGPTVAVLALSLLLSSVLLPVSIGPSPRLRISRNRFRTFRSYPTLNERL